MPQDYLVDLNDPRRLPSFALGALALGGGLRLGKALVDAFRGPPDQPAGGRIPELKARLARMPVEVSEEEAERLREQGINVKSAAINPLWSGALYGAGGTAAALGGWKLVDYLIDKARKSAVKSDISSTKSRIQQLLDEEPEDGDVPTAAYMKAAEDMYIERGIKCAAINYGMLSGLGAVTGATGLLAALAAYKKMKRESKSRQGIKGLSEALRARRRTPAKLTMSPFVRARPEQEDEEEEQPALNQVPAPVDEPASLSVAQY